MFDSLKVDISLHWTQYEGRYKSITCRLLWNRRSNLLDLKAWPHPLRSYNGPRLWEPGRGYFGDYEYIVIMIFMNMMMVRFYDDVNVLCDVLYCSAQGRYHNFIIFDHYHIVIPIISTIPVIIYIKPFQKPLRQALVLARAGPLGIPIHGRGQTRTWCQW